MCGGEIWSRPRRWAWPAETAWRWARWPWTATIRRLAGAGWWRITCGWRGRMRWRWGASSYEKDRSCALGCSAVRHRMRLSCGRQIGRHAADGPHDRHHPFCESDDPIQAGATLAGRYHAGVHLTRSEEHTSELQSLRHLVC